MKRFFSAVLAAGLLLVGSASNSIATMISYSEIYTPGQLYIMDTAGTGLHTIHSWTFDLRDNAGWDNAYQAFSNGNIKIFVRDDGGDGAEKANFTFESGVGLFGANIHGSAWEGIFVLDSSAFSDGLVTATLTATLGDFYFEGAELNLQNIRSQNPVPEHSTLVLLGAGLGGLAIWRKKQQMMPLQ